MSRADWTGDPVMLDYLDRAGLLAEAERLFDAIDRGDTEYLGEVISGEEALARIDALIAGKDGAS